VDARSLGERRPRKGTGWRAITCSALTILQMSRHIPQRISSKNLGWKRSDSRKLVYGVRSMMTSGSWRLVYEVGKYDDYFVLKKDYTWVWGFSSIKKPILLLGYLHMELLQTQQTTTSTWLSPQPLMPCTGFVGQWWQCLDQHTWEHQIN
jgi:hypothetical protein